MNGFQIDIDFIRSLEGGPCLKGYVPRSDASSSGVTIASGFDLGQRSLTDLQKLDLPSRLVDALTPYLGLIQQEAVAAVKRRPLSITALDAELIDSHCMSLMFKQLACEYEMCGGGDFRRLLSPTQTVIASVGYQYGNLRQKTPLFWGQVIAHEWLMAISNLRNFGDAYQTRRRKEAALLETALIESSCSNG